MRQCEFLVSVAEFDDLKEWHTESSHVRETGFISHSPWSSFSVLVWQKWTWNQKQKWSRHPKMGRHKEMPMKNTKQNLWLVKSGDLVIEMRGKGGGTRPERQKQETTESEWNGVGEGWKGGSHPHNWQASIGRDGPTLEIECWHERAEKETKTNRTASLQEGHAMASQQRGATTRCKKAVYKAWN